MDNKIEKKPIDKIKWAIDRAHDMDVSVIGGPFHSSFSVFTQQAPTEEEYEHSAAVLYQAGEYAAQANIILAMEAINRFECYLCNTMEQATGLAKKVNHPNVQVMYDTHHAHYEEKSVTKAIETVAPFLKHVHISENDRGTPGDGQVRWEETFENLAKVNYEGWFTIEAFTRSDPDFANAINVWREYSKPWDMAEFGYDFIQSMIRKHKNS